MAEETNDTPKPLTPEEVKAVAIKAWYDADTREKKAEVVRQYPVLKNIFSCGQH